MKSLDINQFTYMLPKRRDVKLGSIVNICVESMSMYYTNGCKICTDIEQSYDTLAEVGMTFTVVIVCMKYGYIQTIDVEVVGRKERALSFYGSDNNGKDVGFKETG